MITQPVVPLIILLNIGVLHAALNFTSVIYMLAPSPTPDCTLTVRKRPNGRLPYFFCLPVCPYSMQTAKWASAILYFLPSDLHCRGSCWAGIRHIDQAYAGLLRPRLRHRITQRHCIGVKLRCQIHLSR